jgi:hypothetical protein
MSVDDAKPLELPRETIYRNPKRVAMMRLQSIEEQILLMERGVQDWIGCPYCGMQNPRGIDPLCCELFQKGLTAVTERMFQQRNLEQFKKIVDRVQRN